MIEPYFALWLHATQEIPKKRPFLEKFREAWVELIGREKALLVAFFVLTATMLPLSLCAVFNPSFYAAYGFTYAAFLIVALFANRITIARDRRIPERRLERKSEAYRKLQSDLQGVGLTTREQLVFLRDEAVRVLGQRERCRETIANRAIEVCVLGGLVLACNLIIVLLEHDLPLEPAAFLMASAVFVFGSLALIVPLLWSIIDRMGPTPLPKLRLFVDDLAGMIVQIPDPPNRTEHRKRSRHRPCAARTQRRSHRSLEQL